VAGAVVLGLSWLVGGLDVLAVAGVVGVWAVAVAGRVILGRPSRDWTPSRDAFDEFWDELGEAIERRRAKRRTPAAVPPPADEAPSAGAPPPAGAPPAAEEEEQAAVGRPTTTTR
jgi:hypothetical protein